MLVRQAMNEWKLPGIIFRPTSISGDTRSGYSNLNDSISIIISGISKLGFEIILIFVYYLSLVLFIEYHCINFNFLLFFICLLFIIY